MCVFFPYNIRHFIHMFSPCCWTVEVPEGRKHQEIMGCLLKLKASVSPSVHQSISPKNQLCQSVSHPSISPLVCVCISLSVHQSDPMFTPSVRLYFWSCLAPRFPLRLQTSPSCLTSAGQTQPSRSTFKVIS